MNTRVMEQPEFTASIRGYDKLQVDDYIAQLRAVALEAEERVRIAESDLEFSRHATIGPRVAEIFDLAVTEAKELRERVASDAEAMRAQARRDADDILIRARELAVEIDADTQRAREEAIATVAAVRAEAEEDLAQLERRKEAHLSDLRNLQESLASSTRLVESGSRTLEPTEEMRALPSGMDGRRANAA